MSKRLPRKRKKQVKKIVAAKTAMKTVTAAMTSAMGMAQIAIITLRPTPNFISLSAASIAEKTLAAATVAMDSAKAIQKIMSEPPNSWREFIR